MGNKTSRHSHICQNPFVLNKQLFTQQKLPLINQRTFAGDQFEIFMKAGEIMEAAFVADLFYLDLIFYQKFAGCSHSYFIYKLRIGFTRTRFEITTERIRTHFRYFGHFV